MTELEAYSLLREYIGNPEVDRVPASQLVIHMTSGLEFLAEKLKFRVVSDEISAGLVATERENPLPADFMWMIYVEWNGLKLQPSSVFAWVRDRKDWRTVPAGNPVEYAIQGDKLLTYPPPDTTAVTTDGTLHIRYIAAPALTPTGVPTLLDMDMRLAIYFAAIEYLSVHPLVEGADKMLLNLTGLLKERLPDAMRRHTDPVVENHGKVRLRRSRRGAAR